MEQTNKNLTVHSTPQRLPQTILEAAALQTPSIASLRQMDRMKLLMQTIKSLTNFRNLVNVSRNMTNEQINYCAESLVDSNEFYMLRPEDLELCFKLVLSGRYGGFYDRLDQPMVFEFIRKYALERHETILEQNKKTQHSNIYEVFQTEPMQKILGEVTDKLSIKEANEAPKIERKPDIFQIILKEWDNLPPSEIGGLKTYQNKLMDTTEYLQFRVNELLEGRE